MLHGSAALFGLIAPATWNAPRFSTAEPIDVALFIAVGAPGLFLMTALLTSLQENAPAELRGRIFAAIGVAAGPGQALGMLGAGLLGDQFGPVPVLNAQACPYLLAGLIAVRVMDRPGQQPARPAPGQPAGACAAELRRGARSYRSDCRCGLVGWSAQSGTGRSAEIRSPV